MFVSNLSSIDRIMCETIRSEGTPIPNTYLTLSLNNYLIEGVSFTAYIIPNLFSKLFKSDIFFHLNFRQEFFVNANKPYNLDYLFSIYRFFLKR